MTTRQVEAEIPLGGQARLFDIREAWRIQWDIDNAEIKEAARAWLKSQWGGNDH